MVSQVRMPTFFGLSIDKLEDIVNKATEEQGLNGPKLMHKLIFILYMFMMSFILIYFGLYKTLDVLNTFCQMRATSIPNFYEQV